MDQTDILITRAYELLPIFAPATSELLDEASKSDVRLAYYTSAETALKIIENKELWFRDVRCMNDHSEISTSQKRVLTSPSANDFIDSLDAVKPGASATVRKVMGILGDHLREVYICCASRHASPKLARSNDEDAYGRLSMWRAYGGSSGVALIFKPPFNFSLPRAKAVKVMASPVIYCDDKGFDVHMSNLKDRVKNSHARLAPYSLEEVVTAASSALLMLSVASKHPGFEEEQEVRFAYVPGFGASSTLLRKRVVVAGMPQVIHKLKLEDRPDLGVAGYAFTTMFDSLIIGPSTYPDPIHLALTEALDAAGVTNAASRVRISNIPLRTPI